MKLTILTVVLFLCTCGISAQTKFGIVTYTAPANWQTTQKNNAVILDNNLAKGPGCRISIFATEPTIVNSEALFIKFVAAKAGTAMRYEKNMKVIKRSEQNGTICYGTKGAIQSGDKQATACFYTVTNGKQTFLVQLIYDSDACITDFKSFWAGLLVDTGAQEEAATSNARRKKAAPSAPAAPAPMM